MTRRAMCLIVAGTLAMLIAGCGSSGSAAGDQTARDNPWFPLRPGTVWRYRGVKDGKLALDVVTATRATKTIQGRQARVLRDRLFLKGKLAEDTLDWYAADERGNVWYLGEDTRELDSGGRVKSRAGSWQAGRNGARAGIFMPANPKVGQHFRQEFYAGQAEDQFRISSLSAQVRVPAVSSRTAMRTREWTRLEPG